jgi:hypothetical protein
MRSASSNRFGEGRVPRTPSVGARQCATLLLIAVVTSFATATALADCVGSIANCTTNCDQRTKPEDPQRRECAQKCISGYSRCVRLEQIVPKSGGTVLKPEKQVP